MKQPPDSGPIWSAWNKGRFLVGDDLRPHLRITVEPGFSIHQANHAGNWPADKMPVRWWQRADNSQVEMEIPGLRKATLNESIDQDGWTADFVFSNDRLNAWNVGDPTSAALGQEGYLTPTHGNADNRWGYTPNEWENVLGCNALLRVYEGFGGHGKTIEQAVADGNLVLRGVWLSDDTPTVTKAGTTTTGTITLHCRQMAKLAIDQEVFPTNLEGIIPVPHYPLAYNRFYNREVDTPIELYGTAFMGSPSIRVVAIENDNSGNGYWIVGSDGGLYTYGLLNFFGCPDGGGLVVSDSPTEVVGLAVTATGNGYFFGLRNGQTLAYGDASTAIVNSTALAGVGSGTNVVAIETADSLVGYWLFLNTGVVHAFGTAGLHGTPTLISGATIVAAASTPTGLGYWMVDDLGHVYSFGDAVYYGGISGALAQPITGMSATSTGKGYILVAGDGGVFCFGDAEFWGSVPGTLVSATIPDAQFTAGSNVVTTLTPEFASTDAGKPVSGNEVPLSTTVTSFDSSTQIHMSNPASTGTGSETDTLTIQRQLILDDPVVGIIISPDLSGYWLGAADGGVFTYRREAVTSTLTNAAGLPNATVVGGLDPEIGISDFAGMDNSLFFNGSDLGSATSMGLTLGTGVSVTGPFALELQFEAFSMPSGAGTPITFKAILAGRCSGSAAGKCSPVLGIDTTDPLPLDPSDPAQNFHVFGQVQNTSGSIITVRGTTDLAIDVQYGVALDYDGTTLRLWLSTNGAAATLEASAAVAGLHAPDAVTPFMIARDAESPNCWPLDGEIDEFRLSNASRYASGYTPPTAPFPVDGSTVVLLHLDALLGGQAASMLQFLGSLPGGTANLFPYDGNYRDFTDIIKDLLMWSGFWLNDGGKSASVYGILESTGTYSTDLIDATVFDKQAVVDAITTIKEIVGYVFYVDDTGAAHFHEPNFWETGSLLPDGTRTKVVPTIDERVQLTQYTLSTPDKDIRSAIIITNNDPTDNAQGTLTRTFIPSDVSKLKGLAKPAMWVNEVFTNPDEQLITAQLTALHLLFQSRLGTVSCMANPMLQIEDQVQILERETFEVNIHYIRSIARTYDALTGEYDMQLTTNYLSGPNGFDVKRPTGAPGGRYAVAGI